MKKRIEERVYELNKTLVNAQNMGTSVELKLIDHSHWMNGSGKIVPRIEIVDIKETQTKSE